MSRYNWLRLPLRARPGHSPAPLLDFRLHTNVTIQLVGLVDTGADVSVIPYRVGVQLGFDWDQEAISIPLGGVLGSIPTKAIHLIGEIPPFPPVQLGFAWSRSDDAPILLGRVNFLQRFV